MILPCVFACTLLFAGCTAGIRKEREVGEDYAYADYAFDAEQAQYYMASNAAAAEDGYYYVASQPVYSIENEVSLLYYFDMKNMQAYPLCSRLNCTHTDADCEACLSADECLDDTIWYYNGRIYMIERKAEQDELVSYDRYGRDKKTQAALSVNGQSVFTGSFDLKFCISKGKLYYLVSYGTGMYLYEVPVTGKEKPKMIKDYPFIGKYQERFSLYVVGDKVYINRYIADSKSKCNYTADCLDAASGAVKEVVNYQDRPFAMRGSVKEWNTQTYYDLDNALYYLSVYEGDVILNKLKLDTNENEELYVIKKEHEVETGGTPSFSAPSPDSAYISLKGYDGKYLYLSKGINFSAVVKGDLPADELDKTQYIYVLEKDGTLADTLTFTKPENKGMSVECVDTVLGGDGRYLLINIHTEDVVGFELSEAWTKRYNELTAQRKFSNISVIGVLDKKELTTGQHDWKNVTPE